jgi:hypothetical protein
VEAGRRMIPFNSARRAAYRSTTALPISYCAIPLFPAIRPPPPRRGNGPRQLRHRSCSRNPAPCLRPPQETDEAGVTTHIPRRHRPFRNWGPADSRKLWVDHSPL